MDNLAESKPLVSVLMTAYNREKYIAEAIESVLASTYTNFELIIVDDCSKDNTVAIAKEYEKKDNRIKVYVNEKNLNDYPNRNKAASYAKGIYLKYLDSDDMIYKYSLAIMVEAMNQFPQAAYAFLNYPNQDDRRPFPLLFSPEQAYYEHFFNKGFFYAGPGGTIIRKEAFDNVNGFTGLRMVGDYELWLKLGAQFHSLKIQPALIWWRMHEGQEFDIGNRSSMYVKLNYKVTMEALNSKNCPLNDKLRKEAIRNIKRLQSRRIALIMMKGKFASAINIKKDSSLNVMNLLLCWIPVNKMRSFFKKNNLISYSLNYVF